MKQSGFTIDCSFQCGRVQEGVFNVQIMEFLLYVIELTWFLEDPSAVILTIETIVVNMTNLEGKQI